MKDTQHFMSRRGLEREIQDSQDDIIRLMRSLNRIVFRLIQHGPTGPFSDVSSVLARPECQAGLPMSLNFGFMLF